MTGAWWLSAVFLLVAALVVAGIPGGASRARLRAVLRRRPAAGRADRDATATAALAAFPAWTTRLLRSPRRTVLGAAALAALPGVLIGGPVLAVGAAVYGGLAARSAIRRVTIRAEQRRRSRQLDDLGGLAADLRAGLPASAGSAPQGERRAAGTPTGEPDRIDRLTRAAARLAERTGAPLAELLDRIEADARALDRGLAAASAQAAGARATAWLLAALPLGGIALGYAIGADPLRILLHTPLGAGCAVGAIVLQLAGLAWAERLSDAPARSG